MFRHEEKYVIKRYQYEEIKRIISVFTKSDPHTGPTGEYMIRSLYYDDMYDSAYNEKIDGVYQRKKYRIRVYNCQDTSINLECKIKVGEYISKENCPLTRQEYDQIIEGNYECLLHKDNQMAKEFYIDVKTKLLCPRVIVDYEREPYIYDPGTVRITFDKNVRAANKEDTIFSDTIPSYNVLPCDELIMEIKYTGYMPERIRQIFKVRNFTRTSASKYCLCVDRMNGIF